MLFFVKMRAGVLDLWLDECFGPKWPITGFLGPDPKVKVFLTLSAPIPQNGQTYSNNLSAIC